MDNKIEYCLNCKEPLNTECACLRNKCLQCGEPVGNITFTVCDNCWDKLYPDKTDSQPEIEETQEEDLETAHWVRIINDSRFYDGSPHDLINLIAHFKKLGFTLTRKAP